MNFTLAPAKSFLTSSVYISKPLTMSLPTWANGPVIGAMKPMRSSSAAAFCGSANGIPSARQLASSIARRTVLTVMTVAPLLALRSGLRGRAESDFLLRSRGGREPLAQARRNAHQPARQIQDDQDIDAAQHVLPPRHHRAEIFTQAQDDPAPDGAAHQSA